MKISFLIVLFLTSCIPGSCARKPVEVETPKHQLTEFATVSLKNLDAKQQSDFIKFANDEICPCDCPLSFAACLQKENTCKPAVLLANWLTKRMEEGMPFEIMGPAVSQEINAGFSARPQIIDLDGYNSQGVKNAPYTLVEFADFECPSCKQAANSIDQFLKKHPEVRFVFKHFPLDAHKTARPAALASEAASLQNKFWAFHHKLFQSHQALTESQFTKLAQQTGLKMPQFTRDLSNPAILSKIDNSLREGQQIGIQGTPALFWNGRPCFLSTDELGLELRLAMEKARSEASCH